MSCAGSAWCWHRLPRVESTSSALQVPRDACQLLFSCAKLTALQLGLKDIEVIPSNFAEDLSKTMEPLEYVHQTASEKALDVYKREVDNGDLGIIIAADTVIISHGGNIIEKPRNPQHHLEMLKKLRDEGSHKVATAVVVMRPLVNPVDPGYRMETRVEETTVRFDPKGSPPLSPSSPDSQPPLNLR